MWYTYIYYYYLECNTSTLIEICESDMTHFDSPYSCRWGTVMEVEWRMNILDLEAQWPKVKVTVPSCPISPLWTWYLRNDWRELHYSWHFSHPGEVIEAESQQRGILLNLFTIQSSFICWTELTEFRNVSSSFFKIYALQCSPTFLITKYMYSVFSVNWQHV